ncbi:MAG: hypothetical protein P1U68_15955 [Verrucomicrobiales bacterium]|nr:hypothetical protein [Verrucomicrobiales bacterium]
MHSNSSPTRPVHTLDELHASWHDIISSFPHLVAEVENHAARAVKLVSQIECSPGSNSLMDLDGSFYVDLSPMTSAYAIEQNESELPDSRLEFDYPDYPALVRLWDLAGKDDKRLSSLMASLFSVGEGDLGSLKDKRERESPCRAQCPCCRDSGEERARYASMHPLFDILMLAVQKKLTLQVRILSPFAELAIPLLPYQVEAENGMLCAVDKDSSSAFYLDVRWLHAMRIKQVELDGTNYALLIGYDSFGSEIFHLASPDPADVHVWTNSCEWSRQFFSK